MDGNNIELIKAIVGAATVFAGALLGHWFGRRKASAESEEIIGKAWGQVTSGQADHIDLLRGELKLARDEINSTRNELQQFRDAHEKCEGRLAAMAREIAEIKEMVQP